MNSQNHEHQKNNLKNVSKSKIIYLGILASLFVNTTVANGIEKDQNQNDDQVNIASNLDNVFTSYGLTLKKPEVTSEVEINFTDLAINTITSVEEIIREDKDITEFTEELVQPLVIDRTIKEVIKEGKQIIESNLTDETYPLDFELIRKYENALKNEEFKKLVLDKSTLKS